MSQRHDGHEPICSAPGEACWFRKIWPLPFRKIWPLGAGVMPARSGLLGRAIEALVRQKTGMLSMLKRHEVKLLRGAGQTQKRVAKATGISTRSVRRIETEPEITSLDDDAERVRRGSRG